VALVNCRSVCNKGEALNCLVEDHQLDIVLITESWLPEDDALIRKEITPQGFNMIDLPRKGKKGGGVAVMFRDKLRLRQMSSQHFVSIKEAELLFCELSLPGCSTTVLLVVIYRPPGSATTFLETFSELLAQISAERGEVLLAGDFNIHAESVSSDGSARRFLSIISDCGFQYSALGPTHENGHTLDLILTKEDSRLVSSELIVPGISDHSAILVKLRTAADRLVNTSELVLNYHKYSQMDKGALRKSLLESSIVNDSNTETDPSKLTALYENNLKSLVSLHAPLVRKKVPTKPRLPWYSFEVADEKRKLRKLEAQWRESGLQVHRTLYVNQKGRWMEKVKLARKIYYLSLVEELSGDPKKLWKVINGPLINRVQRLPSGGKLEDDSRAEELRNFFSNKVETIVEEINVSISGPKNPHYLDKYSVSSVLSCFQPLSMDELLRIISKSPSTTCHLDPIKSALVKENIEVLAEPLLHIVNCSLKVGMPKSLKEALITPILKNAKLDPTSVNNYRPVSNLTFLSKIIERAALLQLTNHMSLNKILDNRQSAYRQYHSTETALLRVHNDIICAMDSQQVTLVVLLDLSAAFDTIQHETLIRRLEFMGVNDQALHWFCDYLTGRSCVVTVHNSTSTRWNMQHGVPQGSVLGPVLFSAYMTPIGSIAARHNVQCMFYADDTQLYHSFAPDSCKEAVEQMQRCLHEIKEWMSLNQMKLNAEKTDCILVGMRQQLIKCQQRELEFDGATIQMSQHVRNLGAYFDENASMKTHVDTTCKSACFHLRQFGRIRKFLNMDTAKAVAHAFVTSRLDYVNSLLVGVPQSIISRYQKILNTAARIILQKRKHERATPLLYSLHWLPVQQRITFKIALMTYKILANKAPLYLMEIIEKKSSTRALRSSQKNLLEVNASSTSAGGRSFSRAAATVWNDLPEEVKNCPSVDAFKSKLKTYLFSITFT
jgi:hypothetical protein